mgnify:FL=1
MPKEKESYLTGIFVKKNKDTGALIRGAGGAYLLSGSVTKDTLVDAVKLADDDAYDLTLWLDVESIVPKSSANKRPTKSGREAPDGSLKIGPQYVPPARPAAPIPSTTITDDDIPF